MQSLKAILLEVQKIDQERTQNILKASATFKPPAHAKITHLQSTRLLLLEDPASSVQRVKNTSHTFVRIDYNFKKALKQTFDKDLKPAGPYSHLKVPKHQ